MVQHSRVESLVGVREVYERLRASVRQAVVGKDSVVDLCLVSRLAGCHALLTDVPGWVRRRLLGLSPPLSQQTSRASSSPLASCPWTSPARVSMIQRGEF